MSRNITWKFIAEHIVEYEEEIDGKAYFDKVISLWKEYPNAISHRIQTSVKIDAESDIEKEVMGHLGYSIDPNCNELEIYKFVTKYRVNRLSPYSKSAYEISFYEEEFLVRFFPVVLDGEPHPQFQNPYSFGLKIINDKVLNLQLFQSSDAPEDIFLKGEAFDHMAKWLKNVDISKTTRKTNALMDKESYLETYHRMRELYGKRICESWTENSNPEKAVFEDCAIASYISECVSHDLIPKPRKAVDLGCGNGLLVHLLNKINISTYGVDVRHRKIWKNQFKDDDLRESVVDPQLVLSNQPHYDNDVDFLIGNHSDELTPWIPVMAAKVKANFFLIPCCPFNFSGKYCNNGSHLGVKRMTSQYESFFEWTVIIAQRLGFDVKIDRLAIPSTKRLCIIGRIPDHGLEPEVEKIIELLTEGSKFVARPHEIKVNNCRNIPIEERDRISKYIFNHLLNLDKEKPSEDAWNTGGVIGLGELAGILSEDDKKLMKSQDGGLQTFLKNQHQVFHVFGGTCRIRDQRVALPEKKTEKWRKKSKGKPAPIRAPCWMAANHPNGCPVSAELCRFAH
ncbi:unnamed protein product [Caenorhabditis angaria]|uniref:tRNA (uracil-O(2)-)-methyltransferase n=1 Tax=Caenorhabditis angaria TaxID=860376 RepID=A0A9P1MZW8_9PELO|nr:unnamed protein product [Caenorhabditis angaria]